MQREAVEATRVLPKKLDEAKVSQAALEQQQGSGEEVIRAKILVNNLTQAAKEAVGFTADMERYQAGQMGADALLLTDPRYVTYPFPGREQLLARINGKMLSKLHYNMRDEVLASLMDSYHKRRIMAPYLKRDPLTGELSARPGMEDEIPVLMVVDPSSTGVPMQGKDKYSNKGKQLAISITFLERATGVPMTKEHAARMQELIQATGLTREQVAAELSKSPLQHLDMESIRSDLLEDEGKKPYLAAWLNKIVYANGFRHRMVLAIRSVLQVSTLGRRQRIDLSNPPPYEPYGVDYMVYYNPPPVRLSVFSREPGPDEPENPPLLSPVTVSLHRYTQLLHVERPAELRVMVAKNDAMIDTCMSAQIRASLGISPGASVAKQGVVSVLDSQGTEVTQDLDSMIAEKRWHSLGAPILPGWHKASEVVKVPEDELVFDPWHMDKVHARQRKIAARRERQNGNANSIYTLNLHYPADGILEQLKARTIFQRDLAAGKHGVMKSMSDLVNPVSISALRKARLAQFERRAATTVTTPAPVPAPAMEDEEDEDEGLLDDDDAMDLDRAADQMA
jgi:hypothetical protein